MIRELLVGISEIPTPDAVVQQIISTAADPNASAKDLEKVISMDVGLSTKILKLVNSAYYGLPRKVTKLSEAIVIIGFKTVRNLALSVFTYSALHSKQTFVDHDKMWAHFMLTAVFSEHLGKMIGFVNREELFLAGMMHDVGKLAIDLVFPMYLHELSRASERLKIPLFEVEIATGIEPHTDVGEALLRFWKFPEDYVQVAQLHERPSFNTTSQYVEMACVVHLANVFSNIFLPGYSLSFGEPFIDPVIFSVLGLKPSRLEVFTRELHRVFEKSRDLVLGGVEG